MLADPSRPEAAQVQRLLLCTGKVAYDLVAARAKTQDASVAIVRVEQLYPFPAEQLRAELARYPRLQELTWVQEEPKNMGAWTFMSPHLTELAASTKQQIAIRYVGLEASASPATGFQKTHELEQTLVVEEAMSRGQPHGR